MTESIVGTASLRVEVPAPGDPDGSYAGGAFVTSGPRNLTGYNALTFYAKASKAISLDVTGFGNDNTGTSRYTAQWAGVSIGTEWAQYVIPVPNPDRLSFEGGLFFLAESAEGDEGHIMWFDEIVFATVDGIANPRPSMRTQVIGSFVGVEIEPQNTRTIFEVNASDQVVDHSPHYFTFASNDTSVVEPDDGDLLVVGGGSATITATLRDTPVAGQLSVNAVAPPSAPPDRPTLPAADVISLFSNAYSNVPVDTWSADWDQANVADIRIQSDDVKAYTSFVFAGIEFTTQPVDATAMTHVHLDVYVTTGGFFRIKLVDFGADGEFGGGDDSEFEVGFTGATNPPYRSGEWVGLDVPLALFTGLQSTGHLAQMILSSDGNIAFVDNVYFHR